MSQTTKRDAGTAFGEELNNDASRKKRTRKHRHKSRDSKIAKGNTSVNARSSGYSDLHAKSKESLERPSASLETSEDGHLPDDTLLQISKKASSKLNKRDRYAEQNLKGSHKNGTSNGINAWIESLPTGGIFVDQDPILTPDNQYLILPTQDQVQLYAATTSLLVRSISVKEKQKIKACCVSSSDPTSLLTVTSDGSLLKHSLTTGKKTGQWKIKSGITSLTSIAGDANDRFVGIRKTGKESDDLLLYEVQAGLKAESKSLLRVHDLQCVLVPFGDGSIVAACGSRSVHIGVRDMNSLYTWHEFQVAGRITSFDVRVGHDTKFVNRKVAGIDVVTGLASGAIHVYEDVLLKLMKKAKGSLAGELVARVFHWHRSTVRSVKWSKDGNYIISGGDETVLVIWQLETNQKQFLPHLSAPILNISISSTGGHYALRLGDNSVMVLSTADLSPSTNVTGLSLIRDRSRRPAIQLHPLHSNVLLAAISTAPFEEGHTHAATHLQTWDIDTNLQLSRQALARNMTTAVNVAPDGHRLQEPDISHVQISFDGDWLATVDRWTPDITDIRAMHPKEEDSVVKHKYVETVLRFWTLNADGSGWELITRIDEPHVGGMCAIVDIASNPSATEFATIGCDGVLKIWKPRRRTRDGVQVRDKSGASLFTWNCVRSVKVEDLLSVHDTGEGALAYSEDGSVLVVSWPRKQRYVHVIDPHSGVLVMSLPNLLTDGPATIIMMGRRLICLSRNLIVFDLITLQIVFTITLVDQSESFLVGNRRTNTFAVGVNAQSSTSATIRIFDPEHLSQGPVFDTVLPGHTHALLSGTSTHGFVVLGRDCKIRRFVSPGDASTVMLTERKNHVDITTDKSLEDVFGNEKIERLGRQQKMIQNGSSTQELASVFPVTTATQASISDLFNQVSKIFT